MLSMRQSQLPLASEPLPGPPTGSIHGTDFCPCVKRASLEMSNRLFLVPGCMQDPWLRAPKLVYISLVGVNPTAFRRQNTPPPPGRNVRARRMAFQPSEPRTPPPAEERRRTAATTSHRRRNAQHPAQLPPPPPSGHPLLPRVPAHPPRLGRLPRSPRHHAGPALLPHHPRACAAPPPRLARLPPTRAQRRLRAGLR
ncbi:hypothetical protein B0J12DRAFT_668594 [Macrophomina phaseolina]|uniref:Uncharacterized protein n=1 Tax=Macrophomina phaseolina TaxID=35725 RepID=A0ABQ8G7B0_9PEZI|nr:hypothetical protein B0J12DRAFT_668594 [Macrophomina phaseolina]